MVAAWQLTGLVIESPNWRSGIAREEEATGTDALYGKAGKETEPLAGQLSGIA